MWVIISPISSMCPESITLGVPPAFRVAKELPILSPRTSSANFSASVRQALAAAPSLPLGPGVESRFFKSSYDASLMRSLLECRRVLEQQRARSTGYQKSTGLGALRGHPLFFAFYG